MSLELLPLEIIQGFDLSLSDVVSIQRVSKIMYIFIQERCPRIFSLTSFRKGMERWINVLMNIRLEQDTHIEDLSVFANVHT